MTVGSTGSSVSASSTSIGSATNTGPRGGVIAILIARRSTRSSEPGWVTRAAYLVTGRAIATRSAAIWASIASYRTPDSPATQISGACPRCAW